MWKETLNVSQGNVHGPGRCLFAGGHRGGLPSMSRSFLTGIWSPCRYDLDACDIQQKYPDLFQVNLEVEVEPRDRPSREAPPWEGTSMRGLNPKILFSSRDEQQDILSKFGRTLGLCSR